MILMRTKYLENSLRDSSLPQYSIAKILFIPGSLDNSKMPFEQLFLDDPLTYESFKSIRLVTHLRITFALLSISSLPKPLLSFPKSMKAFLSHYYHI